MYLYEKVTTAVKGSLLLVAASFAAVCACSLTNFSFLFDKASFICKSVGGAPRISAFTIFSARHSSG